MSTGKRIKKELLDLKKASLANCSAGPEDDNIFHWVGSIVGPEDTPYENGIFELDIRFPEDYPYRPPDVRFKTPIFHCNVSERGVICLDILKDKWSPVLTISKVLLSISSLMSDPNPDDPLRPEIAEILRDNKEHHDALARLETSHHA